MARPSPERNTDPEDALGANATASEVKVGICMNGRIRLGQQGRYALEREDGVFVWMEVLEKKELREGDIVSGSFDGPRGELLQNHTQGTKLLAFIRGIGSKVLADRFVQSSAKTPSEPGTGLS